MGARYRITAPVEGVVSTVAGVAFYDSVAETGSDAAVAYFRRHGYQVEEMAGEDASEVEEGGKTPSRSASKADWLKHAVGAGMAEADAEGMTRDQLADKFLVAKQD